MSVELLPPVKGGVRRFSVSAPLPAGRDTPHDLVAPHETAVYRLYDEQERLLYVGISWNPFRRWAYHQSKTRWFVGTRYAEVEVYLSRRNSLAVEREAIATESPMWNVRSAFR